MKKIIGVSLLSVGLLLTGCSMSVEKETKESKEERVEEYTLASAKERAEEIVVKVLNIETHSTVEEVNEVVADLYLDPKAHLQKLEENNIEISLEKLSKVDIEFEKSQVFKTASGGFTYEGVVKVVSYSPEGETFPEQIVDFKMKLGLDRKNGELKIEDAQAMDITAQREFEARKAQIEAGQKEVQEKINNFEEASQQMQEDAKAKFDEYSKQNHEKFEKDAAEHKAKLEQAKKEMGFGN